jgi:penicillin G amidase
VNSRVLRLINVSIALLALIGLVVIYWFAYRPLPKTAGSLSAPVRWSSKIVRDERGIPHIETKESQDAYFLEGFVMAQDRLWQMDGLRRFGAGELAEVAGPSAVEFDKAARRLRMRSIGDAWYASLDPDDREAFQQFARGVNYFIEGNRGDYSLEFSIPGHSYSPRPWTPSDSLVIGLLMFRDLTDESNDDLELGRYFATGKRELIEKLFPAVEGQALLPGSNSWAVSGAHTASGKPILANDPHLTIRLPSIWYQVHLRSQELNVEGVSIPGVPGVIIGHNRSIAWGLTNLQADVMDLYREHIDMSNGQYMFGGQMQQAQLDRQVIGVYGARPVTLETWVTRHGPVALAEGQANYSVRWTAALGAGFPFLALDRATNWTSFRAALSKYWGPPQNFVYADAEGHIGYQAAGAVPIRQGFAGNAPLAGDTGTQEWSGVIPFDEMPSQFDPSSGIIATANQNPFPADFKYPVTGSFADRYRVMQIRALLGNRKLTVADMLAIQKDVYSAYHRYLAQRVVAAGMKKPVTADQQEAINLLRNWSGQMENTLPQPAITQLLSEEIGRSLLAQAGVSDTTLGGGQAKNLASSRLNKTRPTGKPTGKTGSRTALVATRHPAMLPRPQIIETLVRESAPGWVPQNDWDGFLLARLNDAISVGHARLGSLISKWRWGNSMQWKLSHPVGSLLPMVDRFFNIGPVPMSGASTTVKQTGYNFGPSMRMVVDWGALEKSVLGLPGGESGFVASSHYEDQWDAYYAGSAGAIGFEDIKAKEVLQVNPAP